MEEFQLFEPGPLEEFYSVGMMIGTGYLGKYVQIQISGGLGVVGGVKRGKLLNTETSQGGIDIADRKHYDKDYFIMPSIPLEVDFTFKPIKYAGIGFTLWGDLNYKKPMIGVLLKVGIGKLR